MSKVQGSLGRGLGDLIGEVSNVRAMPNRPTGSLDPVSAESPRGPSPASGSTVLIVVAVVAVIGWGVAIWRLIDQPEPEVVVREVVKEVRVPTPMPQPRDTRADWARTPALPGLHIQGGATAVRWIFQQPIFRTREELMPDARTRLTAAAKAFLPHVANCALYVEGHTEAVTPKPGSSGSDSVSLGFRRAMLAAEVLREAGVPAASIRIVSPGEARAPYPNASEEGRRLNRTVTILIKPLS